MQRDARMVDKALEELIHQLCVEGSDGSRRERHLEGEPEAEEDLIAEVQRLRAENAYLKKLRALVLEEERRSEGRK